MLNSTDFIKNFKYKRIPNFLSGWRFIPETKEGDCNDFVVTVAFYESGGWIKFLLDILTFRTTFWLVKSPVNKLLPRHVAMYRKNKGWIDSTRREWRERPFPHKKVTPLLFPWVILRMGMGLIYNIFTK